MLNSQNVQTLFFYHKQLPSTQSFAKKHQSSILPHELWVIQAQSQTHGYGRRGHSWQHQSGNLAATFSWIEQAPPPSAIQVADLLCHLLPTALKIKWPNDLLFEGKKVGGILIERDDSILHIGIGLNLVWHPEDLLDYQATHLHCLLDPTELARNIAKALLKGFYRPHNEIDHFAYLGERVMIDQEEGLFHGVTQEGAALLEQKGLLKPFFSGTLRPSPSQ